MAVFAVVPVKNLSISKRRLSSVFTPQERSLLTLAMLQDVLKALQQSVVDDVVVIGNDDVVKGMADKFGAFYLEANQDGLNPAIEEAVDWCVREQADWVLILPADIPLLTSNDVNQIVELGVSAASMVLSPSNDGGTNALFQSTPTLVSACFGPKSFAAHVEEAHCKGVKVRFYSSLNIGNDIDCAEDFKKLFVVKNSTLCREVLEQISSRNLKVSEYLKGNSSISER
jgi:2-phospho-L-lactate/phosphoenolpyruvate guanylyltransferase